jgi:hypothetical protein
MSWQLTNTALLRHPAPPVFLEPRHWPQACWDCGQVACQRTEVSRFAPMPRRDKRHPNRPRLAFDFDPDFPNLGELRDVAAMQPTSASSALAVVTAHRRWVEARIVRYGPLVKPAADELRGLKGWND